MNKVNRIYVLRLTDKEAKLLGTTLALVMQNGGKQKEVAKSILTKLLNEVFK